MRFRKIEFVDAVKWDGHNVEDLHNFFDSPFVHYDGANTLYFPTIMGPHKASVGDYVVRRSDGEFSACKSALFEAMYELCS